MKNFYKKPLFWIIVAIIIILIYGYNQGWFSKKTIAEGNGKMRVGGSVLDELNSTLGQLSNTVERVGQIKNQISPQNPTARWTCNERIDGVNCTRCSDDSNPKNFASGGACGNL